MFFGRLTGIFLSKIKLMTFCASAQGSVHVSSLNERFLSVQLRHRIMHTYGRSSRSSFNPPLSAVKTKKKKKKASRLSRGKKASILEKREERKERGGVFQCSTFQGTLMEALGYLSCVNYSAIVDM